MEHITDAWNVQHEELSNWAYDENAGWPDQDFDLSVSEMHFSDLIIKFSIDDECPKNTFFLSCAYIIVGDAVMTEFSSRTKAEVEEFLSRVKATNNVAMELLYKRSTELLNDVSKFDYDLWCGEGYANQKEN